ncbi:MAG: hypothetical protein DWH81_00445 [Planctomycetota bacterium]|nr:MAG: hypothetical protein DWH81_00445 [Planctomycetota bacterium]
MLARTQAGEHFGRQLILHIITLPILAADRNRKRAEFSQSRRSFQNRNDGEPAFAAMLACILRRAS